MLFIQEIEKIAIKIIFWWCLNRYYLMFSSQCYYKSSKLVAPIVQLLSTTLLNRWIGVNSFVFVFTGVSWLEITFWHPTLPYQQNFQPPELFLPLNTFYFFIYYYFLFSTRPSTGLLPVLGPLGSGTFNIEFTQLVSSSQSFLERKLYKKWQGGNINVSSYLQEYIQYPVDYTYNNFQKL